MNPLHKLIKLLAPDECLQCGAEGALLCSWCRSNLPHVQSCCYVCGAPIFDCRTCGVCFSSSHVLGAVYRRTWYSSPAAKQLIWKLKFDRSQSAALEIAEMLAPLLKTLPHNVIVTHVPTAPPRIRQRGYDQAQLIARAVARILGLPYRPLLMRVNSADQIGANRNLRAQQLQNAFALKPKAVITNGYVLLIDDVLTSGATLESAAHTLLEGGIRRVDAAVFAYTPSKAGVTAAKLL